MIRSRRSGFAMIELVVVISIVTVASVPILGQFARVASSTLVNEEIQTAAQLAQERAEGILARRRDGGYAAVALGTAAEALTGRYAAYSREVTVTEPSAIGGCASGAACKSVVVRVRSGSSLRAEVALVLADY